MADKTIPQLDPVVTPAATDRFGVRQAGDIEDKRETREQVHTLESGEHLILPRVNEPLTPTLAFGDGDTGIFEGPPEDTMSFSTGGTAKVTINANGLLMVATSPVARLIHETATLTNPVILPTGITSDGFGGTTTAMSIIMESLSYMTFDRIGNEEQITLSPGANFGDATDPFLSWGDGDTGWSESTDDELTLAIAGVAQSVTGLDGKLFVNTLTGVGFQGGNIISATPGLVSIYGARSATAGVDGGAVEIWGGYAAGTTSPEGGRVGIWGGGGGGSEATGGNIEMFGGEADIAPGDIILTGGVATVQGNGGFAAIRGGAGFGTNATGGRADMIGGQGLGTLSGGQCRILSGDGGGGVTGNGGLINITAGDAAGTGLGGALLVRAGIGSGNGAGGAIDITGGLAGSGGTEPGGAVTITGGDNQGGSGAGGAAILEGGSTTGTGIGGAASLLGGDGAFNSAGGLVTIASGAGGLTGGDGGDINLTVGLGSGAGVDGTINLSGIVAGQILLAFGNTPGAPAYGFSGAGDTGMYLSQQTPDQLSFSIDGVQEIIISGAGIHGAQLNSGIIYNENASATNPTLGPVVGDDNTGIGRAAGDALSIICGGIEALRLTELSSGVIQAPAAAVTVTAFAGGGQGSATALTQSYNVITVVATAGDSVRLPDTFRVSSLVYIKNDDAAEAADVFPASGDDLGAGLNTAVSLAAGESLTFIATVDDSTWTQLIVGAAVATDPFSAVSIELTEAAGAGSAADPTLKFGDGNTGFYESIDNDLELVAGGADRATLTPSGLESSLASSWEMRNEVPTATNPVFIPAQTDTDTGVGWAAADQLSLIAGAVEGVRFTELNSNVIQAPDAQIGLTAFATGGQGSATQVNASYAQFSTVATLADSGRLPPVFAVGSVITVKNDGAADMDMFPSSGDDLGAGTDTAVSIVSGTAAKFLATVADATWTQIGSSVAV